MSGSRGQTPLFEVLANRRKAAQARGEGSPPAEVRAAAPADAAPARDARHGRPEPIPAGRRAWISGGRLSVPLATVYASTAAVLAACLLAFLIGFRAGHGQAEAELMNDLKPLDVVPLVDPLVSGPANPAPGSGGDRPLVGRTPVSGETQGGPATSGPALVDATPANAVLGPGGVIADPRRAGHNYLELASLSGEQAEAALEYLAGAGVSAIAVPVDRGRNGSNNRDPRSANRLRLVTTELAIPSGRFSALDGERRTLERRLAALGRRWAEEGGWSDFRDPLWRRYDP